FGIVHAAAVVGIARSDVGVARGEGGFAAARAQQQRPARREAPPGLRVDVVGLDLVAFVAPQRTAHARRLADEILEAAAVLALALAGDARGDFERAVGKAAAPGPARVIAGVAVVQVDHAARVQ